MWWICRRLLIIAVCLKPYLSWYIALLPLKSISAIMVNMTWVVWVYDGIETAQGLCKVFCLTFHQENQFHLWQYRKMVI